MQVRGEIRRREVAEWVPYARQLGPLASRIEAIASSPSV